MNSPRFQQEIERVAMMLAVLAIALSPIGGKIAPLPLSLSELALLGATVLLFPAAMEDLKSGSIFKTHAYVIPFLMVMFISAIGATDYKEAIKEIIQLLLYCGAGIWVFIKLTKHKDWIQDIRLACTTALVLGVIGTLFIALLYPEQFAMRFGFSTPVILCTIALGTIGYSISKDSSALSRTPLFLMILILAVSWIYSVSQTTPLANEGTPERYNEAYAALSVLNDYPIFGVGPGNYQLRIGEYYQGMPKYNTIEPGTRIGYTVISVTLGVAGLASFLYWCLGMWRMAQKPLRLPLALLMCFGFLTPLLVSQLLMPLCLLHSLIITTKENEYA